MDPSHIIFALLGWLENNLDQPLIMDRIASKSGYSKWHLQRMFSRITGTTLGSYTRARRLSRAAVALCVTDLPIIGIAIRYHFDSRQSFTRAFKKQFGQTPAFYRDTTEWPSFGICPPIRPGAATIPPLTYVTLRDVQLYGVTSSYTGSLGRDSTFFRADLHTDFWFHYLAQARILPSVLFGLNHVLPNKSPEMGQEVIFRYTTALQPKYAPIGQPVILAGGEYALFTYNGDTGGLQNFILMLYDTYLPKLKLTRRQGPDIECFYPQGKEEIATLHQSNCQYLIPVYR
ncbi:helix-turn-helix domain-containing protein [Sodalis sp. RH24]|uniref:helix-turn-helix domain-containing protein n=1 Tax=unclassified Sodalis (in: enterobacteria) TaxID=2636512 RepID=UPI0039B3CC5D